jgi:hypothetical protein
MKKILESTNASPNHRQQAIDAIAESGSALTKAKRALRRYEMCYEAVTQCPEPMFIERGLETRHGKEIECIKIRPKNMTGLPRLLWPDKVQKIVFTSGTLHSLDIEKLGLSDKRVFEVEVDSIIPKANRPIIPITNVNLASKYQDKNLGKLVETLRMLMDEHPDTKGVIHTTYSLAAKLWPLLQDPRVMYHSGDDKQARLKEYIESTEPKVLVACGMSEGLDLNGHGYAWQAITKIMWPNRGDKLIDELYTSEPDYILWETIKTVIQQAGRICRGPEDQGATYIIDSGFGNVLTRQSGLIQRANRFIPNYFMESLQWQKGLELARRVR